MTKDLVSTLDRAKVGDRKVAMILPAVADVLGYDVDKSVVSYSTIRRGCQKDAQNLLRK